MAHEKLIPGTPLTQDEEAMSVPAAVPAVSQKKELLFPHPVAWLVLAISLLASAGGWFIAWNNAELKARKRFDEEARNISAAVAERMQIYENVLHGALGLFAASQTVERAEWKAYLDTVSIETRFPGIDGVGFAAYVPRTTLEHFLQTTTADDAPHFRVEEPGLEEVLIIVKYIQPETDYALLLGRNIAEDPLRRAAAERACDSGKTALSEKLNLFVEGRIIPPGF